jgi:hypothetical protein
MRCEDCRSRTFTNCLDDFPHAHIGRRIQHERCFVKLLELLPLLAAITSRSGAENGSSFGTLDHRRPYSATQNGLTCCRLALRWRRRWARLLHLTRRRKCLPKAEYAETSCTAFSERSGRPLCCCAVPVGIPSVDRSSKSHAGPICTGSNPRTGSNYPRSICASSCVSLYNRLPAN